MYVEAGTRLRTAEARSDILRHTAVTALPARMSQKNAQAPIGVQERRPGRVCQHSAATHHRAPGPAAGPPPGLRVQPSSVKPTFIVTW
jgi:hypothetical protein